MKYRHRVLGFLSLLAAITYLDRVATSVAGPRMQESLHISLEAWGWVVGIFTVSYGLFEIPTVDLMRDFNPEVVVDSFGPFGCLATRVLHISLASVLQGNSHPQSGRFK